MTSRRFPRTPARRADATSNAARIVAAARRVFARGDGLGSLEEIAREAGVGIATLYRHFAHREALASAVYTQLFEDEFAPALELARNNPSPVHGLRAAAERLSVVMSHELGLIASSGNFAAMTDEMLRRFTMPLQEILLKAQDAGEVRRDLTAEDVPRLLVMVVAGLAIPGISPEDFRRYIGVVFDGLRPPQTSP
ncbi:TetR/AcrR family transcriptional regulator [Demequina sp.]|uniref:TetR/AcrR family transcriptional regulator n=1 Tax=Demequina sp. TaxID=2050685 RepID=UPI0025BE552D|nr:TetR/AcrR family transcriptional regulator [Demequina sp.]